MIGGLNPGENNSGGSSIDNSYGYETAQNSRNNQQSQQQGRQSGVQQQSSGLSGGLLPRPRLNNFSQF